MSVFGEVKLIVEDVRGKDNTLEGYVLVTEIAGGRSKSDLIPTWPAATDALNDAVVDFVSDNEDDPLGLE